MSPLSYAPSAPAPAMYRAIHALLALLLLAPPAAAGGDDPEDTGAPEEDPTTWDPTGEPQPALAEPVESLAPAPWEAEVPGSAMARPPRLLPGAPPRAEGLAAIAAAMVAGAHDAALVAAEDVIARSSDRRQAAAAWMAIGMLHRAAGRANLASEAFTQVRLSRGPLASYGAWYEAEQDLARGRAEVALKECQRYLETFTDGAHAEDCEPLIAFALADLGRIREALEAATDWDERHRQEPITETVSLRAARWEVDHDPQAAVRRLRGLVTWFRSPATWRAAEALLARLAGAGVSDARVPDDVDSLKARAVSLREARLQDEAWALFSELRTRAATDPSLARWVDDQLSDFLWRTARYDELEQWYASRLAEADTDDARASLSWYRYRALDRAGRYPEASALARAGLARWPRARDWRGEQERVARSVLLAGDYVEARDLFEELGQKSGTTGLRNAFYAAFSSVMAGDDRDARQRLDRLIGEGRGLVTEARYWRARVAEVEDPAVAEEDRRWILEHDPSSWYGVLLRTPRLLPARPLGRDGRWPGTRAAPAGPDLTPLDPAPVAIGRVATPKDRAASPGFSVLAWPMAPPDPLPAGPPPLLGPRPARELPSDYPASSFHQPDAALEAFESFVERYGKTWPDLLAVQDLAAVGLHDLSGPLFAKVYDQWVKAVRARDPVARDVDRRLDKSAWRALFLHARDHHHMTRTAWGLERAADVAERNAVASLARPLAHAAIVWPAAEAHDVDPFLVLGLMRTESLFNANAVSRVGARGPMQIMPRTGNLLADLVQDTAFHTGLLHDPMTAIDYGIRYLGLLLDRFEGVFPLAVAAYNGGPHNVSAWLEGTGMDMPLDMFVEHIPYGETRRYVRSVTERYAEYVSLYAAPGSVVGLPPQPRGDHPEIVDF